MLKNLKKNQVVIYVIALMLVAAGYLNYTSENKSIQTSSDPEITYKENLSDIGDATLVSSNAVNEGALVDNEGLEDTSSAETTQTNQEDIEQTQTTSADIEEYFSRSKLERENMYSQMLETYQNIINSNTVSEEQRSIATQEITNINNTKNAIMICENLLTTKGYEKNIVFANGGSVSVVVKSTDKLTVDQVAQIQNVISREMNVEVQNINITEKTT